MNRCCVLFELNPHQESATMHSRDLLNLSTSCPQIGLNPLHILEQTIVFDRFERCSHGGHCQHAATESRTQIVLFDLRSDCISNEACANRNTAAERLRKRDDIGHDAVACFAGGKEPLAGTSNTSLNFIINQHNASSITQRSQ